MKERCDIYKVSNFRFNYLIDQGLNVNANRTLEEDLLCSTLVVLTFYLSLLKHPFFNIDINLRMKIFCEGHPNKSNSNQMRTTWLCMYGMDTKFIKRELLNLANRKSEAKASIEKYFRLNDSDKMYHKMQMPEDKIKVIMEINEDKKEIRKGIKKLIERKIII